MTVSKALSLKDLKTENLQLKKRIDEVYALKNLIGENRKLKSIDFRTSRLPLTELTCISFMKKGAVKIPGH